MSKLANLSLANRSLVALLSIGILAFGLISTGALKQELIPSLQFPGAFVTTVYPGASPEIVEREVTEPIESAIGGTEGLEDYTSTSSNGMSVVQARFAYGTDVNRAVQDIQQAINRSSSRLPDDVDPVVSAGNTDDIPVVMLAVSSDLESQELLDRLNAEVVPDLEAIPGVREAQVSGGRTERVTIDVDEKKLAARGLTVEAIGTALQAGGIAVPGGDLTTGDTTLPVQVGSQFTSLDELRDLPVMPTAAPAGRQGPDGSTRPGGQQAAPKPVRLGDVATIEQGLAPASSITRTDGEPSLGIAVTKTSDANTVTISHDVQDALADLEKSLGKGTTFTVVFDQAPFIEESVEGLTTEGLIGLLMAVLVILVFLLSLRSTLVTAVSIPFSLLVAMIGLYTGGYSLNILTLGALTVAIGRVVDDSIVVLENIKRHLAYGEEKVQAIRNGVREVAGAVTASTVTTAGVFLPIAVVGGQVGELFRPFGVTVAIALFASLLVSLTLIPVLAYWFLRRPDAADAEEARRIHDEAVAKERRSLLQRAYVPVIRWTTRHRAITILVGIAVFVGTMAMTPLLKTNFLDQSGQNLVSVTQTLPTGSSLERADEAAKKVEAVLAEFAEDGRGIESYQVTIGSADFAGFAFGGSSNEATYSITTDDELDPEEQTALVDDLRDRLEKLDDAGDLSVRAGMGDPSASGELEVIVKAGDSDTLETAAARVTKAVQGVDGLTDVKNNLGTDSPSVQVDVDRRKAAALGLSEAQIGQAVRDVFQGQTAGSVQVDGATQDIVLLRDALPDDLDALRTLEIPTPLGQSVRLSEVADVSRTSTPASLTRIDGDRSATITATPDGEDDLGRLNVALQTELDGLDLPDGASWELGGVSSEQTEAFTQLGMALLAAILIVFAVMVATFRSIVQPVILLVSVPFAATGALGMLLLTGTPLGVPGLIGLLMLVGIVVTNAIVLIDLINQYREQGMPLREAVVEGGRRRLRPILMTAIATIFALVPMALGLTGGGVFISKPLAMVVIGGLVSSTLLTLVLVPTLYTMVEGFKERRRTRREGRRRRRDSTRGSAAEESGASTAERPDTASAELEPATVTARVASNGSAAASDDGSEGGAAKVTIEVLLRQQTDRPADPD